MIKRSGTGKTVGGIGETEGTLLRHDWAAEWSDIESHGDGGDDPAYWNERAKSFPCAGEHSSYVDDFLRLADVRPGESVLDMGCGTGALALPLAQLGHHVIAADFSRGMLDVLSRDRDSSLKTPDQLDLRQLSWSDSWEAAGIRPKSVDVALASRSMVTEDIRGSLGKLSAVARRRVCITMPTEFSPRADASILGEAGIHIESKMSYLYSFVILHQMGYRPELRYIVNERVDTFDSTQDARAHFEKMALRALEGGAKASCTNAEALERMGAWVESNLIPNPDAGRPGNKRVPQKALKLKSPHLIKWAFISWEP